MSRLTTRAVSYTVEDVRMAASGTAFHEIRHNEKSKVVSFRSGTTRINVYYATGTVGTCLDDPAKGKTQLFRRNINLDCLRLLFRDPQIHSGKGYYSRKNSREPWEILNADGRNTLLPDSAVRWMYVASATGLSNTARELWKIAIFCATWDSLYWVTGSEPRTSQTRFACGSTKAFANMLLEVGREVMGRPIRGVYFGKDGRTNNKNEEREDVRQGYCCEKVKKFMEIHARNVHQLKSQLRDFPRDIQIELMRWFFARDHCGYYLMDEDFTLVATKFSSLVDYSHVDYANLAYDRNDTLQMCRLHGVLWEPGPS